LDFIVQDFRQNVETPAQAAKNSADHGNITPKKNALPNEKFITSTTDIQPVASLARTPCKGCSIQRHDANANPHVTPAKATILKAAPTPLEKSSPHKNQKTFPATNGARLWNK